MPTSSYSQCSAVASAKHRKAKELFLGGMCVFSHEPFGPPISNISLDCHGLHSLSRFVQCGECVESSFCQVHCWWRHLRSQILDLGGLRRGCRQARAVYHLCVARPGVDVRGFLARSGWESGETEPISVNNLLRATASNLVAMASKLRAMASNLQPSSNGLQTRSDGLQPPT